MCVYVCDRYVLKSKKGSATNKHTNKDKDLNINLVWQVEWMMVVTTTSYSSSTNGHGNVERYGTKTSSCYDYLL
jgi:hypothetical protein